MSGWAYVMGARGPWIQANDKFGSSVDYITADLKRFKLTKSWLLGR